MLRTSIGIFKTEEPRPNLLLFHFGIPCIMNLNALVTSGNVPPLWPSGRWKIYEILPLSAAPLTLTWKSDTPWGTPETLSVFTVVLKNRNTVPFTACDKLLFCAQMKPSFLYCSWELQSWVAWALLHTVTQGIDSWQPKLILGTSFYQLRADHLNSLNLGLA